MLEARWLLSAIGISQTQTLAPVPGATILATKTLTYSASSLTVGPDGNVWSTDQDNSAIARQTPDGNITEFHLPDPTAMPDQIVAGPDGNLWFIDYDSSQIGRITPAGAAAEFALPSPDSAPTALTAGPGGNLWFIDSGTSAVGRITPAGSITEFPFDPDNLMLDGNLVAGPDGNVWAAGEDASGNGLLARITPAGKISRISLPVYPQGLTVGPGKNLWVAGDGEIDRVTTAGTVTRFPIDSGDSAFSIVDGPDGALWFASYGTADATMGRMTRNGDVFEFNPPGAVANLSIYALASGQDRRIWYATDSIGTGSPIASFDPHNALLACGNQVPAVADAHLDCLEYSIATFVDLSGKGDASFYQATINWGDGTTSAGDINDNEDGTFDVDGAHTWPIGTFNITVSITDTRPPTGDSANVGGRTLITYTTALAQPPIAQGTGVAINPVAGQLFSGVVAHYTGVAMDSLFAYSSTIDWGDGFYSAGVIASDGQGGITVSGSNRYVHSGSYTVKTTLGPYAYLVPSTSGTATVSTGVMDGTGKNLQISSKQPFSGTVAAFTLANPTEDLSHFQATIDWINSMKGSYSGAPAPMPDAPITSDGQGGFTVSLDTAVMDSGGYGSYQVLIRDDRLGTGDSAIVGAAFGQLSRPMFLPRPGAIWSSVPLGAPVASAAAATAGVPHAAQLSRIGGRQHTGDAVGAYHGAPLAIRATAGDVFNAPIAILTGPPPAAGQILQATIRWGDGVRSAGTVISAGPDEWEVIGKHTFAKKGAPKAHMIVRLASGSVAKSARHRNLISRLGIITTVAGKS